MDPARVGASRFAARAMGRRRPWRAALAALLLVGATASAETRTPLARSLDEVLGGPALRGARVSALVVRDLDGSVLYQRTPTRLMTPASNAKILTAIAALSTFGPSYQFETVVRSDAAPDAEGAVGVLAVHGAGDPALNSEDWWRLADALRNRGLRRVRGDLLLDDSLFDRERWHHGWGRTSSRAYHAPVGALTANYGAFAVTVTPGARPGDPVGVAVDPPVPYFQVSNGAHTVPVSKRGSLVVDRRAGEGHETVVVRGSVVAGAKPRTYYRSVIDPTAYAGAVLRMQLEAVGIRVDGATKRGDAASLPFELLEFEGRPLAEVVRLFVKYSNNAVAETLVKALGAREAGVGSWKTGVPAEMRALVSLGLDGSSISLVDGSGLSYENKVSPRVLVDALRLARHSFEFGPELVSALPIAAADGTLQERARGAEGRVRAKTGLLNGVTGLSGYAQLAGGDLAVFSVLVNGYRTTDDQAMGTLDRFVAELVGGASLPGPVASP